jgi:argininosuccinate lyase
MIDEAALAHTGSNWELAEEDLSAVLDPWQIVESRQAQGGAAPAALARMTDALRSSLGELAGEAARREATFDRAEEDLLALARRAVSG